MNDFSDVIFLMVAMVVFSMLTINTSRSFMNTTSTSIQSTIEYRAIALAQDELDNIRWAPEIHLNPTSNQYLFDSDPITTTVEYGSSDEFSEEYEVTRNSVLIENTSTQKQYRVTVQVTSDATDPPVQVQLEYIKTYFKE
ncbi:type IV pilus modification PilV family protein [Gracilimonas tropica]|uniref:type IV pilus modification PilV family protein n=1 Tax=Gracilimonas tropica TaxID=454600 RepID=UPI00035ED155|nr:hypothetical protein [Gracilimonas tropica]